MKKFLLFIIVFIASAMSGSIGGQSSIVTGDFFYMHPQNTTANGLVEIAETVISKSLVVNDKEVTCMAKNIFFEAAVESTAGKLAVAHVTLNRVDSQRFPNTVCEVVYEGPHHASGFPKRDMCQFSWYCDGKHDNPNEGKSWKVSQKIAEYVLQNPGMLDITDSATHYYADYIPAPRWANARDKTVKIDTHIFYNKTNKFKY